MKTKNKIKNHKFNFGPLWSVLSIKNEYKGVDLNLCIVTNFTNAVPKLKPDFNSLKFFFFVVLGCERKKKLFQVHSRTTPPLLSVFIEHNSSIIYNILLQYVYYLQYEKVYLLFIFWKIPKKNKNKKKKQSKKQRASPTTHSWWWYIRQFF
jgi:hypothetical protein